MPEMTGATAAVSMYKRLQKMTSSLLEKASQLKVDDLTSLQVFEELKSSNQTQLLLQDIKEGLELQLESFNNVTSSIVQQAVLPHLDALESLGNMTSQMIEQHHHQLHKWMIEEPLEKLDSLARLLGNLKPQDWESIRKALPILIPHWIDHHTPKLDLFIKPGTKLSVQLLGFIHQALKDVHFLLQKNIEVALNHRILYSIADMILQKNTKLMSQILILMFRAKDTKVITLTSEDIEQLQDLLVSPKEIYLIITEELLANDKEDDARKRLLL